MKTSKKRKERIKERGYEKCKETEIKREREREREITKE